MKIVRGKEIMEKLYTEDLSVRRTRFWDLALQKIIRNFTSLKFILFNEILIASLYLLLKGKITGDIFQIIVISALVTIAINKIVTDMRLKFDDSVPGADE